MKDFKDLTIAVAGTDHGDVIETIKKNRVKSKLLATLLDSLSKIFVQRGIHSSQKSHNSRWLLAPTVQSVKI